MQKKPSEQQNRSASGPTSRGSTQGAAAAARVEATSGTSAKTENANNESGDLVQQAKDTTSKVVDQVQHQANSKFNQQKDNAATDLKKIADAVRQMGDGLIGAEQGPIATYAAEYGKKAADNIERLTDYLRANDAKKLVREVEKFGKAKPALFFGAAFLLGFAGARFLKSSAQNEETSVSGIPRRALTTSASAL